MVSLEFFSDTILLAVLWPWVDSASNGNECQVYFLGVKVVHKTDNLTTILCHCHEIWEP